MVDFLASFEPFLKARHMPLGFRKVEFVEGTGDFELANPDGFRLRRLCGACLGFFGQLRSRLGCRLSLLNEVKLGQLIGRCQFVCVRLNLLGRNSRFDLFRRFGQRFHTGGFRNRFFFTAQAFAL